VSDAVVVGALRTPVSIRARTEAMARLRRTRFDVDRWLLSSRRLVIKHEASRFAPAARALSQLRAIFIKDGMHSAPVADEAILLQTNIPGVRPCLKQ
jgi:hypothetical protein